MAAGCGALKCWHSLALVGTHWYMEIRDTVVVESLVKFLYGDF